MQKRSIDFNIKKILIAPLDWGLGHATRCIPIIHTLIAANYEVLIATDGIQKTILQKEFPELFFLPLKGYGIRYSKIKWVMPIMIFLQVPRILRAIQYEHKWLKNIIAEHKIDLIIADNRYGLYTNTKPSVFITHQLTIKAGNQWVENIIQKINYRYINRFTACWVPDMENIQNSLAGILSHPEKSPKIPLHYMGALARLEKCNTPQKYKYTAILSGPEPQRTVFENIILALNKKNHQKILLVRGKPDNPAKFSIEKNEQIRHLLSTPALQTVISESEYIICRSGYTSLMELAALHKKMILIPTPGQTEQAYLGHYWQQQNWAIVTKQDATAIEQTMHAADQMSYRFPEIIVFDTTRLNELVMHLLNDYINTIK